MERWANGAETEQAGANTVWLMPRHSCKLASIRLALWELSFPSPFFPSPPFPSTNHPHQLEISVGWLSIFNAPDDSPAHYTLTSLHSQRLMSVK